MIVFVEVGNESINLAAVETLVNTTSDKGIPLCRMVFRRTHDHFIYGAEALAFAKFWRGEAAPGTDYTAKHLCPQITKIHLRLPAQKGEVSDE